MASDRLLEREAALRGFGLTLEDFGLGEADRTARMRRAAEIVLAEWSAIARGRLNTTLAAYLRALAIREVTADRAVVALPGEGSSPKAALIAKIVEFGMGPGGIGTEGAYDVRKFLLRSTTRNIRWGRTGPYVNVPFGHSAGEIEDLGGSPVLRAARQLSPTRTDHRSGRTLWGGRMPERMVRKIREHHASDPLAGMVRRVSTYSKRGGEQSTYMTWRRASLNASSSKAWISSGVKAQHIAETVSKSLPELLGEVL